MKDKTNKGLKKREFRRQMIYFHRENLKLREREFYIHKNKLNFDSSITRVNSNTLKRAIKEAIREYETDKFFDNEMKKFLKETLSKDTNVQDQNEVKTEKEVKEDG